MQCKCGYIDGWHDMEQIDGDKGNFYKLPIQLERSQNWDGERTEVFGCPKCGAVFIEV